MKWGKFRTPQNQTRFQEGDWNVLDDRSGRKVKASETGLQWDGMRTTRPLRRHEQDFLRSTPERTPWTRVEPDDTFVNGDFTATNDAGSGSTES